MKRYLISALAVTTILIITAALSFGSRFEEKHRGNWVGYGRPTGMAVNRFGRIGGGPLTGKGKRTKAVKAALYLKHAQELKLTDDQVKKLKNIETSCLKDMIDRRAELAAARIDLNRLLDSDNPDMTAVEKNVRAIYELRANLEISIIRGNKAADAVLTTDQKKMVRDLPRRMHKNLPARGSWGRQGMMMPHLGTD